MGEGEIERGLTEMAGIGLYRDAEAARVREAMLPAVDEDEREPPEDEEPEPVADNGRPPAKPPRPFDNQRTAPGSPRDVLRKAIQRQYERQRFYLKISLTRRENELVRQVARLHQMHPGQYVRAATLMLLDSGAPVRLCPLKDAEKMERPTK